MLWLFLLLTPPFAHADGCQNYCVGIRGNGEAVPAQWAALSRMVEENGMPKATAGGSSATITMFLLDSMSGNAHVKKQKDAERKRKMQALMLKSMPEFLTVMAKDTKIPDGLGMIHALGGADPDLKKKALEAFRQAGNLSPAELQDALSKYGRLLNPELLALVQKDPAKFGKEAYDSINNLGDFNAKTDANLFFRPGVLDFKGLAMGMGYMADFYAGNTDSETKAKLDSFLSECAESAYQKDWSEVPETECRARFQKIAADYLNGGKFQHKALFQKVGENTSALPTTSIVQGTGVKKYFAAKKQYETGDFSAVEKFALDFDKKEVSFGYWGKPATLDKVNSGLEKYRKEGDLKAKMYRPLGPANWFEVLATSPAEPGIANFQKIPTGTTRESVLKEWVKPITERWKGLRHRGDVLSAGGWSDLHPTAVLKAQGCSPAIYLTRQSEAGDTVFGQQVMIRLSGAKDKIPFWENIEKIGYKGWCPDSIRDADGDPAEVAKTAWHKLVNLCNPDSSFRRALDLADGSYCTDWNNAKYNVFKGRIHELTKNAYESPLIPTSPAGLACQLNSAPDVPDSRNLPSCLPFVQRSPGFPRAVPRTAPGAFPSDDEDGAATAE